MKYKWNSHRADESITKYCEQVTEINIIPYTKEKKLSKININEAYEMNAVHMYIDILNLKGMLTNGSDNETITSHTRTLRFFDSHFKAIKFVLDDTESIFVDFHNQRLHTVIAKPYDDEKKRLDRAITIAKVIIDVVEQQRELGNDDIIDAAKLRVGIDSGLALAVNNGRRSNKEPLFLGDPANHAAKHSAGTLQGIYLTKNARAVLELETVEDTKTTKLKLSEIDNSLERANIDYESLTDRTITEVKEHTKKLSDFAFSRLTPTFESLDFSVFTRKNSKRLEMVSLYADIDGFTKYISENIGTVDGQKNIVRCLHVLRAEMDSCLTADFKGRRVRFIGDCIHGVLCEGTSQITNKQISVDTALEAASGIRSSFILCMDILEEKFNITANLGLAIGLDFGETMLSRVGRLDENTRFSLSLSTINSEEEQKRCKGDETAIAEEAYSHLSQKYKGLFTDRIANNLNFEVLEETEQTQIESDKKSNIYSINDAASSKLKAHAKY